MADNPTRRDALKALAAATGALTLASLPTRWAKPGLSVGAIPAHAQTSCFDLRIDFSATGDAQAGYIEIPTADEGPATPAGINESGTWLWYCGLEYSCFPLFNDGTGTATFFLTSRNGTVLGPIDISSTPVIFTFDPADGSIEEVDVCLI